jgi:hypothetical protein
MADALRDRHVIERKLGRGRLAPVHIARDLKYDRPAGPAFYYDAELGLCTAISNRGTPC